MWPFKQKTREETRSSGTGYTSQIMQARADYIAGVDGVAELTGTVQACVSLWEGGLSLSDVEGSDLLTPSILALTGRALALRGEAVFYLMGDRLIPASDWDLTTRFSKPTAYRLGLPDTAGGQSVTALAGEVLHFRIGCDVNMPYVGQSPLRRSRLTAGLLQAVETALSDVYDNAPIGSQIVAFPETPETDMETIARGFRGNRGRVLIRESVNVGAAGGPTPQLDWGTRDTTPDLSKIMSRDTLTAAKSSVEMVFGILPGLSNPATTGPMVREAQRHLAQWALQPIAEMIGQEVSDKLDQSVKLDVMRPLQAFDAGGRARAVSAVIQALSLAKEAGIDPKSALSLVNWGASDGER